MNRVFRSYRYQYVSVKFFQVLHLIFWICIAGIFDVHAQQPEDDEKEADSTGIELYQRAGVLINEENNFAKGDSLMLVAREKLRDTPFWDTYGATYLTLGYSYNLQRKNLWEVTEQLHKGLEVVNANTDEPHRLRTMLYDNMTYVFRENNATDSARVYVEKALDEGLQALEGEHVTILGQIYGNAANIYAEMGSMDMAIKYYDRAESIFSNILPDDHYHWSTHYNNLAIIYNRLGDRETARNYFIRSKEIGKQNFGETDPRTYRHQLTYLRELSDEYHSEERVASISETLAGIEDHYPASDLLISGKKLQAQILQSHGDLDASLHSIEKAIELAYEIEGNTDKLFEAYQTKAGIHIESGELLRAEDAISKADSSLNHIPHETEYHRSQLYAEIAKTYTKHGYPDKGVKFANRSLEYNEQSVVSTDLEGNDVVIDISNPEIELKIFGVLGEAYALKYEQTNDIEFIDRALSNFTEVVDRSWEMRKNFKEQASSLDLGERLNEIFAIAADLSFTGYEKAGNDEYLEKMMLFTQNSKANTLQNSLIEARIFETGTIPEDIRQEKNVLQSEISHREIQLARAESGMADMDDDLRSKYQASLFELREERNKLLDSIKDDYSEYYNLHYEDLSVTSAELQESLSDDQVVLEYAKGRNQMYILVTDPNQTSVQAINIDEEELDEMVKEFRELASNPQVVRASLRQRLYAINDELYSLFVEPVINVSGNSNQWTIIPDGSLHYVPFELLIDPDQRSDGVFREQPFLIKDHIISYNYSPGLYTMHTGSQRATDSIKAIAPVFDDIDEAVPFGSLQIDEDPSRSVTSDGLDWEGYEFSALPESRNEVIQISELAGQHNMHADLYLAESANKELMTGNLEADIIHIATHGIFNAETPALSGLALLDPNNEDNPNVMMYVPEIYNMDMKADLVVLSSCESGLGEVVRGEGMMAMNRGFIQAGSNNVIYSMWKVSDTYTKRFMTNFYRHHFDGASYAEALRYAKLDMLEHETSSNPAYWAAFMMIGN